MQTQKMMKENAFTRKNFDNNIKFLKQKRSCEDEMNKNEKMMINTRPCEEEKKQEIKEKVADIKDKTVAFSNKSQITL